jgi:hypothetical protein
MFKVMKVPQKNFRNITPKTVQAWPWYKAMGISFLSPTSKTAEALLDEGKVSFKQAIIWAVASSIIIAFIDSVCVWITMPYQVNFEDIGWSLISFIQIGVFQPMSFLALTGFIHVIARLFRSKGKFCDYFIVFIAFNMPVYVLWITLVLFSQILNSNGLRFLAVIITFYILFIVNANAVKASYRIHWLWAFLINLVVVTVFGFVDVGLIMILIASRL